MVINRPCGDSAIAWSLEMERRRPTWMCVMDVLFANTQIACRAASYFRFPVILSRPLLRDINESLAALRKLALGC